jgi:hypothetical protein
VSESARVSRMSIIFPDPFATNKTCVAFRTRRLHAVD